MIERKITPVILSGGAGTRLWPLSREERPKQLLALTGSETMLQMTAARVTDRSLFGAPIIVASERHATEISAQLAAIGISEARLVLEPCARNTAAAIALAALATRPDDLLLVMPSDHLIARPAAFIDAVKLAAPAADDGWLVTFGIRPDRPETGYGYIRRGDQLSAGVFKADAFVEKPPSSVAADYVASGRYDWNGGIFLFRSDVLLEALSAHDPEIASASGSAMSDAIVEDALIQPDRAAFERSPAKSIDHAVMEKAERIAVVPVEMQWSDVGSWDALYELAAHDAAGNAASAGAIMMDAERCLVRSDGPSVAVVGVSDLIVIATANAVLVVPRGSSQKVKDVVEAHKARTAEERKADG